MQAIAVQEAKRLAWNTDVKSLCLLNKCPTVGLIEYPLRICLLGRGHVDAHIAHFKPLSHFLAII